MSRLRARGGKNPGSVSDWQRAEGITVPCASGFGTFTQPFHQRSRWNSYPVDPEISTLIKLKQVLWGSASNPNSVEHYPFIAKNDYGVGFSFATALDGPMDVWKRSNSVSGVQDGDENLWREPIHFGHWPASEVRPAAGSDGHAELYDPTPTPAAPKGLLHSLYRLWQDSTQSSRWEMNKYSVTPIDGMGWGYPERPDNSRAAGVSSAGGLLRRDDWDRIGNGAEVTGFPHALACATDERALDWTPVWPATQEDYNSYFNYENRNATFNHPNNADPGVHMGSLLMLPPDFPETGYSNASLALIKTLKKFGTYVVDTTGKSGAFDFYAEIGSSWSNPPIAEMRLIRNGLALVTGQAGWKDGTGVDFTPPGPDDLNLFPMRRHWPVAGQDLRALGARHETTQRALLLPVSTLSGTLRHTAYKRKDPSPTDYRPWFDWQELSLAWNPVEGTTYRLKVFGDTDATVRMIQKNFSPGSTIYDSGLMTVGQELTFVQPAALYLTTVDVVKPAGPAGWVRLEWQKVA